jgi:hypothetical protein
MPERELRRQLRSLKRLSPALACGFFIASCSPQSPSGAGVTQNGFPTACTTGPAYPADTVFPYDSSKPSQLPFCPMRCGVKRNEGTSLRAPYLSTDLPAGACTGTQACNINAEHQFPCPASGTPANADAGTCAGPDDPVGPRNIYYCECSGGAWACWTVSQGSDICHATCSDAGK